MINKYTNKQRGLLAVIMAMVMVFAGAAFVAAEVEAAESAPVTTVTVSDAAKLQDVIDGIGGSGDYKDVTTIILGANIDLGKGRLFIGEADDEDHGQITSLTIDGAGKYSITGDVDDGSDQGPTTISNIRINDADAEIIFKDVTINDTFESPSYHCAVAIIDAKKVTMKNVTVNSTAYGVVISGGDFEADGLTYNGWTGFYIWDPSNVGKIGNIVIKNCTVNSSAVGGQSNGFGAITIQQVVDGTDNVRAKITIENTIINATNKVGGTQIIDGTTVGNMWSMLIDNSVADVITKDVTLNTTTPQSTVTYYSVYNDSSDVNMQIQGYLNVNGGIVDMDDDTIILSADSNVSLSLGTQMNSTIGYVDGDDTKTANVQMIAGAGGLTISEGSVEISGTLDVSEVEAQITNAGSADIILKNLTIIGSTAGTSNALNIGTATIEGSVNITEDVIVTITAGSTLTVDEKAALSVSGKLEVADNTAKVENNGTIVINSLEAEVPPTMTGTGSVDSSGVASEATLSGSINSDTTFTKYQTVTITADTYLVESTILIIEGKLIIPEGVTLYIQDSARLIVRNSSGVIENNGTIIVESKVDSLWRITDANGVSGFQDEELIDGKTKYNNPTLEVEAVVGDAGALFVLNATINNYGTINLDYTETSEENDNVSMNLNGTVNNYGTITVGEDSLLYIWENKIINAEGAQIDVYGEIWFDYDTGASEPSIPSIDNSGTVTFDEAFAPLGAVINLKSEAAVVDIVSMTIGSNDIKIFNSIEKKEAAGVIYEDYASNITISVDAKYSIEGVTVTPYMYTLVEDNGDKTLFWEIAIAGNIAIEKIADDATGGQAGIMIQGIAVMDDDVVLGNNITVDFKKYAVDGGDVESKLYINGNVTAFKATDDVVAAGFFDSANGIITVNGKYSSNNPLGSSLIINAASYEIAKTATTDKTYVYTTFAQAITDGATKITVTGQIEVDSDIAVPSGTTVTNNGTIAIDSDATVDFATGAILKNNVTIDVDGILYVEDRKSALKPVGTITSEVISEGEKDRTYTSLSKALASAQSGDVIKLSDSASIKVDTTIPAGVTVDTNMKGNVTVENDVTLTIDGTLYLNTNALVVAEEDDDEDTGAVIEAGEVVLNGMIKSNSGIDSKLAIPGAYYQIAEKGVPYYYVEPVATAAPKLATTDGMVMTIDAFATEMDIGQVTFAGTSDMSATVTIKGQVAGDITLDLATISFENGKVFEGTVTNGTGTVTLDGTSVSNIVLASETDDEGVKELILSGKFDAASKKEVVIDGTVTVKGFEADAVKVVGNADVTDKTVIESLIVEGTVTVDNGKILEAEEAFVLGTIVVAAADAVASKSAGTFTVTYLYLGFDSKVYVAPTNTAGVAVLDGTASVKGLMYVAAGSTFPADMVKGKKYVELYVEDELWMTVYDIGNVGKVAVNQIPVDNVDLEGWVDDKGKTVLDEDGMITINDKKVYADIDYDVYKVTFVTAVGINDVYVDGILVDGFVMVAAGAHTVSYTLDNGYTGEAKMLVDGKEVSGYTFTTEGEFENVTYTITLQGIEKAPAEVGGGDAPVADKDEGMDLTDILLIVLVVLIVIMAIIVALRMMRS